MTAAPKPNTVRTEEGPSYWAINQNDRTYIWWRYEDKRPAALLRSLTMMRSTETEQLPKKLEQKPKKKKGSREKSEDAV